MLSRIHVNQHVLKRNVARNEDEPVFTVKTYKGNTRARTVQIHGPSRLVFRPENPLACGARAWIETEAEVTCD